jgi:hypothetical protein
MRTILKGTLATLLVVGLLASLASRAFAADRKFHPSACQVVPGSAGTLGFFPASGQATNTGAGALTLWCPLINDGPAIINNVVTLRGFPVNCPLGTPGVKARSCFSSATGATTTCGAFTTTCSPGVVLNPNVPPSSASASDYPFLEVVIQQGVGGGFNTFFGYTMTNQ